MDLKAIKPEFLTYLSTTGYYRAIFFAIIILPITTLTIDALIPDCKMIHHPNESDEYLKSLKFGECGFISPILRSATSITFALSVAIAPTSISHMIPNIHRAQKHIRDLTRRCDPRFKRLKCSIHK